MEKAIRSTLIIPLFLALGTFVFLIINQFFQQDEWHSFGLIQSYNTVYLTLGKPLWESILSDRIGARILMFSFYKVFAINPLPFGVFAAVIHFSNTFLVYKVSNLLTKKKIIAVLSASFFLVNSVGYQAYAWYGTMMGSAVSVFFILVSFIFYILFLQQKKYVFLFLSIITIFISFLFKELAISLLMLYPLLWIINPYQKKTIRSFIFENIIFFLYGIAMTMLLAYVIVSIPGDRANYIEAKSSGYIKLLQHAVAYPFQGTIQPFVPFQIIFEASRLLTILLIPTLTPETSEFDAFYQTRMAEVVIFFLAIAFIGVSVYFYLTVIRKIKREVQFAFAGSFIFLFLSYVPYIVLDKFDAYLDLRYYYIATIPASLLFGIFAYYLYSIAKDRTKKIVIIGFALLFIAHVYFLFSDLFSQYRVGRQRQSIIQQLVAYVPHLDKKTVFYITGNSPGYYGIPELKVPFQSGLGQVLATVYISKQQLSAEIFPEETLIKTLSGGFLYDTLAQGYKKVNGQGFGYYYDEDLLLKEISENKFEKKDVVSLFYDSDTGKIEKND